MAHVKKKQNKYGPVLLAEGEHLFKTDRAKPHSSGFIYKRSSLLDFRENSLKVIELSSINKDALIASLEKENSLKQLEPH